MSGQVFAALVAGVVGFGGALGLSRQALLDAAGLEEPDLADPDGLVPYRALTDV